MAKTNPQPGIQALVRSFRKLANPAKAKLLERFFKTGPGEYGEGDRFLGIVVPQIRAFLKNCLSLPLQNLSVFLTSKWHEERLLGLLVLTHRYPKAGSSDKNRIYRCYLRHWKYINNWDLVDLTTPHILGAHLENKSPALLYEWTHSKNLWKRRMAILATFHWIRKHRFKETLEIAAILLRDTEDLLHKAAGWMLREIGKRSLDTEECFLEKYARQMPRTMLRYAIERFPEKKRRTWLAIKPSGLPKQPRRPPSCSV